MGNLWSANTPARFWLCEPNPPDDLWNRAILEALPILGLNTVNLDELLSLTLGEKQFGEKRWNLGRMKSIYYGIKPLMPLVVKDAIRRLLNNHRQKHFPLGWPIEPRYAEFQWEVLRQVLLISGRDSLSFRYFWPSAQRYAFVLTHDIESAEGQANVRRIADLEESLGFRSSFAFVPESYPLDYALMDELRRRGFEIAVHGLKHDGKDFMSYDEFMRRVPRINHYLKEFRSSSFYAALTLRQPEWMQVLEIEYDRSFFDTDPYEPNAGGVMSIWPYTIGHFIEFPYTLAQDYTLAILLQQREPRLWIEKIQFIKQYHGMGLMVTHPDYLKNKTIEGMYFNFLQYVKDDGDYCTVLPHELAKWWRKRADREYAGPMATAVLENDCLRLYPAS